MSTTWDDKGWRALASELDTWHREGRPATFWWRDDDAGRPHEGLTRLLGLAVETGLPLGLAVVPAWLRPEVAETIRRGAALVAVLQHGFAHTNHETVVGPGDRKVRFAECGAARPVGAVLRELEEGGRLLRASLGPRVLPVLVPPWNRIAPPVEAGLPSLGYRALSTFGPRRASEPAMALRQLNCHVDPILWREAKRFAGPGATLDRLRSCLADRRAGRADATEATGLLTHHRDMDPAFWSFLHRLWRDLRGHPAVAFPPLPTLLAPP